MATSAQPTPSDPELRLPATLLSRYLFFLGRRPVSAANAHYLTSRIAALQSLAPLFDDARVTRALRALTPANLFRLAPQIQHALQPQLATDTPRDLVATSHAPDASFWNGVQRLLVIYGPAIGIGDEILASSIPRALRKLAPSVTVMTAYDGLWDRVQPGEQVERYRDLSTIFGQLRGDAYDTIFYVDFEPAGLVTTMAHEPRVQRFVELSLGTRLLTVLDSSTRRLHQMPGTSPYHENFYRTLEQMLAWLGTSAEPRDHESRVNEPLIVASPFTSKEEPSEKLWSGVLAAIARRGERLVLDTGPNSATRAFAQDLRDALRAGGARAELAANGRAASIGEMLDLVATARAVVTADSYLAHAGPVLGAKTFVIARQGLEPWRVPAAGSFYFRSAAEPKTIGDAIGALLIEPRVSPRQRIECTVLRDAASALDFAAPRDALLGAWQRCFDAHNAVVAALPDWPAVFAPMLEDERYGRLMPRVPVSDGVGDDELRAHLASRFADCAGSNLWKFVRGTV